MTINIELMTGNYFTDGTAEAGKIITETVTSRQELDDILDSIEEGQQYIITDEDGDEVSIDDLMCQLD